MVVKDKLLEKVCCGDERAYQGLFRMYYADLVAFAYSLLKDLGKAEDVVQEFFVNFWCEKKYKNVHSSLDSYLFRAVKNACLNHIRDERYRVRKLEEVWKNREEEETGKEEETEEKEAVYKAIAELPEQCRRIFMMCCVEGKKYQEAADALNISVNTVRTQMGRAFKTLREKLAGKTYSMLLLHFFTGGWKFVPEDSGM